MCPHIGYMCACSSKSNSLAAITGKISKLVKLDNQFDFEFIFEVASNIHKMVDINIVVRKCFRTFKDDAQYSNYAFSNSLAPQITIRIKFDKLFDFEVFSNVAKNVDISLIVRKRFRTFNNQHAICSIFETSIFELSCGTAID